MLISGHHRVLISLAVESLILDRLGVDDSEFTRPLTEAIRIVSIYLPRTPASQPCPSSQSPQVQELSGHQRRGEEDMAEPAE